MDKNPAYIRPPVLVADDDHITRMLLRASITQWNCPVIEAKDGEEALSILSLPDAPKIATIDWVMPKMNGIDLCKKAKELDNPPYIILLTSVTGGSNLIEALDAGADDFITKPFSHAELRSRLFVGMRIILYEKKIRDILKLQTEKSKKDVLGILKSFSLIDKKFKEKNKEMKEFFDKLENKELVEELFESFCNLQKELSLKIEEIKKLSKNKK